MDYNLLPIVNQSSFLPVSAVKLDQDVEHETNIDWCLDIQEETCGLRVKAQSERNKYRLIDDEK